MTGLEAAMFLAWFLGGLIVLGVVASVIAANHTVGRILDTCLPEPNFCRVHDAECRCK